MKNNAIIRIILWSVVIVLLLAVLFGAILGRSSLTQLTLSRNNRASIENAEATPLETSVDIPLEYAGIYMIEEETLPNGETLTLPANEVTDIEIDWVSGAILIQPTDVTEIQISESDVSDEKYAMCWKLKNNKLTIQFCEESITNFGLSFTADLSKDLTIFVPRDWSCDSLEIDAASATLEVNDLTIREVEIDTASGACRFDNCVVDQIDLDTASGDVTFVGSLKILDCDAASASFVGILTKVPQRIAMDSMSGDLDITLPVDAGFTVIMDTMSSDFSSDFETTMKNGNYVHGDGSCRINVDAMSGDVTIRKAAAAIDPAETHEHTEQCTSDPNSCPDSTEHHTHDSLEAPTAPTAPSAPTAPTAP